MSSLKVLLLHGLGDHRDDEAWPEKWEKAIMDAYPESSVHELSFAHFTYDDIFANVKLSTWEVLRAIGKLLYSAATSLSSDYERPRRRGFFSDIHDVVHWSAGYVVAWVEDRGFQKKSRKRVYDRLLDHKPDILVAHSLGSLVSYNALLHKEASENSELQKIIENLVYVTLGSQLGNPFVRKNLTGGRLVMPNVKHWTHLYNVHDDVFTAQVQIMDTDKFQQVDTPFDIDGIQDHAAECYLRHSNASHFLWRRIAGSTLTRALQNTRAQKIKPKRRAVLIGINEYANPGMNLNGCVNDVFLMSSVLQELKFAPEQIRICLNDRATAEAILQRMNWLVQDAQPGDELVFYFSGHGAQLPAYNSEEVVDHMDETLVPHNFDWSPSTCITDDRIYDFYSQLPYGTKLFMIFDCCHSGGMDRGNPLVRGLEPPDDIRHRALEWNAKVNIWQERVLADKGDEFTPNLAGENTGKLTNHMQVRSHRLGRSSSLRTRDFCDDMIPEVANSINPSAVKPYLPVIMQACQESEFAYEYRHGSSSYGAFTYTLAKEFRAKKKHTLIELQEAVTECLNDLNFNQTPSFLGPSAVLNDSLFPSKKKAKPKPKRGRKPK